MIGGEIMKFKKLIGFTFLSLSLMFPYFSSASAETSQVNKEKYYYENNKTKVTKEIVQTENGQATFTRKTEANGTVYAELIEKDFTTIIEYDPNTKELFVNGEKQEFEIAEVNEQQNTSRDFSIMAVPSGGTYVGAFNYSLNIATLTASAAAAALSTVTKAPYSGCLAAVSVFIGSASTLYYTIYQYRYPMKCSATPYFNQTKVWTNSSRSVVSSIVESGKFFSSQPIPSSCTP